MYLCILLDYGTLINLNDFVEDVTYKMKLSKLLMDEFGIVRFGSKNRNYVV